MHSFHRSGRIHWEAGDQVDTFLRLQVDDVDSLLPQLVHAALGVDAIAHDHLAEAELID